MAFAALKSPKEEEEEEEEEEEDKESVDDEVAFEGAASFAASRRVLATTLSLLQLMRTDFAKLRGQFTKRRRNNPESQMSDLG